MAERETLSNVSSLENSEFGFDNEETDDDTLQEYLLDVSESAVTQNTAEDPEMASQNNRENIEENCQVTPADTSVKNKKFVRPGLLKRKIHQSKTQESASSQIMAYILAEKEAEKKLKKPPMPNTEIHPVDAFLAGIAPSLKSLNPFLLNETKSRIFSTVQESEMKQLLDPQGQYRQTFPNQLPFSPASTSSSGIPTTYISPIVHHTDPSPVYNELRNSQQDIPNETQN
mgnify:FL=1